MNPCSICSRLIPSTCIYASKYLFASLNNDLISLKPMRFGTKIFMEQLTNNNIFFTFATYLKSSKLTTSRELRQQFVACSE